MYNPLNLLKFCNFKRLKNDAMVSSILYALIARESDYGSQVTLVDLQWGAARGNFQPITQRVLQKVKKDA